MKKLKLLLLLVCAMASYSAFSQHSLQNGLWRGIGVFKDSGERMYFNFEEFIWVKNDSVRILGFGYSDKENRKNVSLVHYINSYALTQNAQLKKKGTVHTLKLKKDTVAIYESGMSMSFAYFKTSTSPSLKTVEHALLDKSLTLGENIKITFQKDGKAHYLDSVKDRFWTSEYCIVQFENYVFLKSSSAAPVLILSVEEKTIKGVELLFNQAPKPIELHRN